MKFPGLLLTYSCLLLVNFGLNAEAVELDTEEKKLNYAFGVLLSSSVVEQGIPVEVDVLTAAMRDALSGNELQMTQAEIRETVVRFQQQEAQGKSAMEEENRMAGQEFLSENKEKEGVVTLENGLQYKVITAGTGDKPQPSSTVKVHYRGTLIDGTEFDSSYSRGTPAVFPVGGVIQGWQKILPMMPTGSKWEVFIPSDLAYGERGTGNLIGPNATLVFEIELLEIQ